MEVENLRAQLSDAEQAVQAARNVAAQAESRAAQQAAEQRKQLADAKVNSVCVDTRVSIDGCVCARVCRRKWRQRVLRQRLRSRAVWRAAHPRRNNRRNAALVHVSVRCCVCICRRVYL